MYEERPKKHRNYLTLFLKVLVFALPIYGIIHAIMVKKVSPYFVALILVPTGLLLALLMFIDSGRIKWQHRVTQRQIAILLAALVVLAGFYWIEVRPVRVRHNCNARAVSYGTETAYDGSKYFNKDAYQEYYEVCTRKGGL